MDGSFLGIEYNCRNEMCGDMRGMLVIFLGLLTISCSQEQSGSCNTIEEELHYSMDGEFTISPSKTGLEIVTVIWMRAKP